MALTETSHTRRSISSSDPRSRSSVERATSTSGGSSCSLVTPHLSIESRWAVEPTRDRRWSLCHTSRSTIRWVFNGDPFGVLRDVPRISRSDSGAVLLQELHDERLLCLRLGRPAPPSTGRLRGQLHRRRPGAV